jgi:hypothetical protein
LIYINLDKDKNPDPVEEAPGSEDSHFTANPGHFQDPGEKQARQPQNYAYG